jgi:hypothetical protein
MPHPPTPAMASLPYMNNPTKNRGIIILWQFRQLNYIICKNVEIFSTKYKFKKIYISPQKRNFFCGKGK